MKEDIIEKQRTAAMRKVVILEKMMENSSRSLYLDKERLHEQKDFLNNIVESLPHPVYVIDVSDYSVILANLAARNMSSSKYATCYEMIYERSNPCEGERLCCPLKEVLKTKKPVTVEHIQYDKNSNAKFLEFHAVPMLDNQGKIVQLIEYIVDITTYKRAVESTQQKISQLMALRSIDMVINASMDRRVTFDVVMEQVMDQLNIDAADILVYSPYLNTFEFLTGRGFRTDALKYTKLCLGEGYAGKAARERRTVYVRDINEDGGLIDYSDKVKEEGFVSYYGVPLISKGEVKGVIEVFGRRRLENGQEWLDLFEIIAGQSAIALDNSMMFETIQHDNTELLLAYDATIE